MLSCSDPTRPLQIAIDDLPQAAAALLDPPVTGGLVSTSARGEAPF